MAKTNRATRTATPVVAAITPTVDACTTIDAIVAFARTVTPATFVTACAAIRAAFTVDIARRNVGRTTNRRIVDFQNWTFDVNATWGLDDIGLAFVWTAEFPAAVGRVFVGHPADIIAIVRNVRAQYNTGKHANVTPAVASVGYGDVARMKSAALFPRVAAPAPAVITPAALAPVNVPASAHVPAKTRGRKSRAA